MGEIKEFPKSTRLVRIEPLSAIDIAKSFTTATDERIMKRLNRCIQISKMQVEKLKIFVLDGIATDHDIDREKEYQEGLYMAIYIINREKRNAEKLRNQKK